MGLSSSPILHISRALGEYLELLNKVRIARGKPKAEADKAVLYILKVSAVPTLGLALASYIASKHSNNPYFFFFTIPVAASMLFLLPLAVELLYYATYVKSLREDIAYFMVLEGASPGDDLVRDLEEESEHACGFLPSMCNEYMRLKLFFKFFPGIKGIKEYVLRAPKPMRKLLLEYIVTRESADFGTWIYSKFQESLRELKTSAKNSLELKTILSLTAAVFNGLTPPLIALVIALTGSEVQYTYITMAAPAIALAISESATPRLLKISVETKKLRYLLTTAFLPFLLSPMIGVKTSLVFSGATFLALGAVATQRFVATYLSVVSIPSQLISLADRVPYAHRPIELVEKSLGDLRSRSVFTSLCYYMLLRSIRHGSVDTTRIIAFKDIVEELFSLVKQSIAVRLLVIATALFLPLILSFSTSLVAATGLASGEIRTYCFISSLFYSVIATLTTFGTLENTALVGLVLLELYALGVTP
ncbi:MAG: hypothetical protein QXG17_02315 [Sulfolobales archaeon]